MATKTRLNDGPTDEELQQLFEEGCPIGPDWQADVQEMLETLQPEAGAFAYAVE